MRLLDQVFDLINPLCLTYSDPATLASFVFLQKAKHVPDSGSLHLLFPLPGMFFLQTARQLTFQSSLSSLHNYHLIREGLFWTSHKNVLSLPGFIFFHGTCHYLTSFVYFMSPSHLMPQVSPKQWLCLFCSLLYPKSLAHGRCSINIYWKKEWILYTPLFLSPHPSLPLSHSFPSSSLALIFI